MSNRRRSFCTYTECVGPLFPPCCVNIFALAGTKRPCRVCAPWIQSIREMHKYKPVGGGFFIRDGLSKDDHAAVLKSIHAKLATPTTRTTK